MIMTVRKIGNSRGVIIPAAILETCGIDTEIDLQIEGRTLIMKSPPTIRAGWFDSVAETNPAYDSAIDPASEVAREWDSLDSDEPSGDWQW
jgi:antitoxin MazE